MPDPQNGADPVGPALANEMLQNLIRLNANIEKSHQIYETLAASIADLCDYHETYMRASEILMEQAEEGKSKFALLDFAKAVSEAAAEVMPEEGEDDDEHGEGDARVRIAR